MNSDLHRALSLEALQAFLKTHDAPSSFALNTLLRMHGPQVGRYAEDLLGILDRLGIARPFELYIQRSQQLRPLQADFERTGAYAARTYAEVKPIADELYKVALLLSFICTSHRFEILQSLVEFLRLPGPESKPVLSVGYGTGYELKLAYETMPGCNLMAFDNSPMSYDFAARLLGLFGYSTGCLYPALFPFDPAAAAAQYGGRFGKAILCELLEHLEQPDQALAAVRGTLAPGGLLFCTMAVNLAQEDHIYLYRTADEARQQVLRAGFTIVQEKLAPAVVRPFTEAQRAQIFKKGNYICVAQPA